MNDRTYYAHLEAGESWRNKHIGLLAIRRYRKAINADPANAWTAKHGLGISLCMAPFRMHKQAEKYLREVLREADHHIYLGKENGEAWKARILRDLSKALSLQGKYEEAFTCLDDSASLYTKLGDTVEAAMSHAFRARIYLLLIRRNEYHKLQTALHKEHANDLRGECASEALAILTEAQAIFLEHCSSLDGIDSQPAEYLAYNFPYIIEAYLVNREYGNAYQAARLYEITAAKIQAPLRVQHARQLRLKAALQLRRMQASEKLPVRVK